MGSMGGAMNKQAPTLNRSGGVANTNINNRDYGIAAGSSSATKN